MPSMIDIISRDQHVRQSISSTHGIVTLVLDTPSVVRVHESAGSVVSYARQGDDLLIHNDERVIQLSQFFQADAQGQTSDLVFGSTLQTATHVTFSQAQVQAAAASADEAVVLTPQLTALPEALAQTLANANSEKLAEAQGEEQAEGQADAQVSTLQAEAPVLLADEVPSLSIDAPLAGDDVISAAEYGQALEITGTSTGLQTDDVVLVVLNGKTYSTAVEADGSWKVVVLAEDMLAVPAGVASIAASVTSASGAVVQDSHSVFVITGGVQVTIDELAGDGLLNAAEAQQPLSVTGSVNNASAGDEVVVSVLDREYTGVVDAQGQWSVDVPADIWQRLTDGDISVTATVTNAGGNSGSATREMTLDTQIPSVAINTLAEDDIVNAVEHGQALEVSGTTTGLKGGEVISVELDGQTYTSTVSASGEWSVVVRAGDVAALSDGEHTLTATVESHAGNPASGEHTMVVNTVTPTVTINSPLAGDGVIDATELSQSLEVSGTSTGLDAGSIVNVSIGDHNYTTEVEADGSWFLGLSRLEVSTFDDGLKIVSVSATNPIGNTGEATDFVVVNSEQGANFVVIDPITGDDQINAAEAASELAITGTAAQAPAGAVVTVTIDGKQYTGYVAADGSWSVPVSADAWADLADGNVPVTAEVSSAGSSGSATRDVLLDTEAPTLTLNPLAGDDIINAAEQQQALGVSGTTTGLSGGEVVTVELNGKSYTTTVSADGNWELYIGAKDVTALADGEHSVTASVSDAAGNPANVERDITVAASGLPTLTITTPLAGDDVINAAEHEQLLPITGASTGLAAGTLVTVELNGKTYSTGIAADGSWSMAMSAADVSALPDGTAVIVASATDSAGNTVDTSHQVTVDTIPPALAIDPISDDGVINAEEAAAGVPISGTAEPGAEVVVQVGDNEYIITAGDDSAWSVMVPAEVWESLPEGEISVTATATDSVGNSSGAERSALLETSLSVLTIDGFIDDVGPVTGEVTTSGTLTDDATPTLFGSLNAPLKDGYQLVIASKTGDVIGNSSLPVFQDDFQITDSSWSFALPEDFALPEGVNDLYAYVWAPRPDNGSYGLVVESNDFSIHVDSEAGNLPTLTITTPLAGDDVINAIEHDQPLEIRGTSTGLAADDVVRVSLNGKDYAAVVASDGSWALVVSAADASALPDGAVVIAASATDSAGNTVDTSHQVTVDTALPALAIDPISDDGVINAEEAAAGVAISGTAEPGAEVVVQVGGNEYTVTAGSDSAWSVMVPAEVWESLPEGEVSVTATATDSVGNRNDAERSALLESTPAFSLTIDGFIDDVGPVTGEVTNSGAVTDDATPTLFGSLSAPLKEGDELLIASQANNAVIASSTKNPEYFQITDTSWSFTFPEDHALSNGVHDLFVFAWSSTVDGNSTLIARSNDFTIHVDSAADTFPTLTITTPLAGDDVINAAEHDQPLDIRGTSTELAGGDVVRVSLNGKDYAAVVASDGSWTLSVPAGDVGALPEGSVVIAASATSDAGNTVDTQHTITVDTTPPSKVANITGITDDTGVVGDFITSDTTPVISGGTNGAPYPEMRVEVSLDGGKTWQGSIKPNSGGYWQYAVEQELADGQYEVMARLVDAAGNWSRPDSVTMTVDTTPPVRVATIDSITDDTGVAGDFITSDTTPVISGGTGGAAPYADIRVEVSLDSGKTWHTASTPAADGSWEYAVEQELADGQYDVMARLIDAAGNWSQPDTVTMIIDTTAPTIAIDVLAGDDIVNATEHGQALVVSGTTKGLDGGETVQITLNGKTYTTAVATDGRWSLNVPASDVSALADGDYSVIATVEDIAGNQASTARDISVVAASDSAALSIMAPLAGDDVINAVEHEQPLTITGGSSGLAAGTSVTVALNGKDYVTTVAADGGWALSVSAGDVAALPEGQVVITASAINGIGNSISTQHSVTVDTVPPTTGIQFTAISDDTGVVGDFITSDTSLTIHLVTTDNSLYPGNKIQVSLDGGATWNDAERNSNWDWSYTPEQTLADGQYDVMARTIDPAGNVGKMASQVVIVDTRPPVRVATIDSITEDTGVVGDFITSDTTPVISGGTGGAAPYAGIRVEVSLDGGKTWDTASTPAADGSWEYAVGQALADGQYEVMARLIDEAGNWSQPDQVTMTIDTKPAATLTIDVVAGDDIIDAQEAATSVTISGDSTGLVAGTKIAISVAGESSQLPFLAEIQADGSWQINLSSNDIAGLGDGSYLVRASSSAAGVSAERTVQVDTTPSVVSEITIDGFVDDQGPATGDVTASGSVTDDATPTLYGSLDAPLKEGYQLVIADKSTGQVIANSAVQDVQITATSWSYAVPSTNALINGVHDLVAYVWDSNNSGIDDSAVIAESNVFGITVDAAGPAIAINTLAGDDIVNAVEYTQALTVSGTTSGLSGGETVDVTLNGKSYIATVAANGNWAVNVSAGDVAGLANGTQTVAASVRDAVGNVANAERAVLVDTTPPAATIRITAISDDTGTAGDFITSDTTLTIHGSLGNTLYAGNRVQVSVDGGKSWDYATVNKTNWSYVVPNALSEGQHNIQARTIETKTGNVGNMASQMVTVDVSAPTITINTLAGDDIVNAVEYTQALTVSGATSGLSGGESVDVTLNGKSYTATVAANGSWSINVPTGDVAGLANGTQTVTASVRDAVGNVANAERAMLVDTTPPAATIRITAISDDTGTAGDFITSDTTLTIHGTLGNTLYSGNRVQVSVDGGKTWDFATVNQTNWSYVVPSALSEGQHNVQARTIETKTGNIGNLASQMVTIDANADAPKFKNPEDFEGYSSEQGLKFGLFTVTGSASVIPKGDGGIIYHNQSSALKVTDAGAQLTLNNGWTANKISFRYGDSEDVVTARFYNAQGQYIYSENKTYQTPDGSTYTSITLPYGNEFASVHFSVGSNDVFRLIYLDDIKVEGGSFGADLQPRLNLLSAHDDMVTGDDVGAVASALSEPVAAPLVTSHEEALVDNVVAGTSTDDIMESTQANDHFTIGNGGNDTLTYRLLDATDATGGNGADRVSGFTVGKADATSNADRIDLRELLVDGGYQGAADGEVDAKALANYLKVTVEGSDTEIAIDRDGTGSVHEMTTMVTLSGVQTDLATLLANHQLVVN
ncbi:Ig-like domain-containing protein [Halomonas binhaiensis]|uniref:Ig-like domain-containing protein n=1 Tax=Halomonas binhaiensis TaxID=2562282 RepID=A0A5C1NN46_9GAMM|nr:Ig-like domain-containing protein [Halomonas binhaiensis]QEM83229.1 Ig-like domain-containing protein [Halomonas binhaiensis]